MIFERVVRPMLFRVGGGDAEAAHEFALRRLAGLSRMPAALAAVRARYAVRAPRTVFGVRFPNPVGLAAGMDKDGVALPAWPALGFGFVEVGTVTARPQPGNDRPRLFRLRDSEAVVNGMGFNNAGAEALAARLAALPRPIGVPLGISLGKSKVTPLAEAVEDYRASYRVLRAHGDYFAVNVSSPNTPGLRSLQDRTHLDALLAALVGEKPVLVKIAPDLTEPAIAELLEVCLARGAAGVIATNTTLARDGLAPVDQARGALTGGMSGRPLAARAREVVAFVHRETGGRLPIVGVGGIVDPDDAARMMDAGASLVQLFTGFIYRGPALVRAAARTAAAAPGKVPSR
ncbi:quinone-dependent dihydroorotate dehydrogenase [Micromonospora sp. WMMA1363]|uniref:quinone-dependent dihydroorotate dehydrogenase n=1 Tax=Micromonospora sp. WMMA1363 TaxID=3053985 RepID=UPI00259CC976|nr:quinone-dependent dihydroorotate dehydrogenase [Micromonospora sp. WMMA1363]MDM4718520.1 quinone-dependent dihydroorotate dehydrogenase [Micromonospora sp. WMMA1363]